MALCFNILSNRTISMIKTQVLFMLIILCSCNNNKHNAKNDLHKLKLHGSVKKIEKNAYEVKLNYGELEKVKPISRITIEPFFDDFFRELYFDTHGNITRKVLLDSNNVQTGVHIMKYDEKNRLIEDASEPEYKNLIIYDDKNQKSIEHAYYKGTISWEATTYKYYDKNENIIKKEIFEDEKLVERTFYEYNNANKKTIEKIFSSLNDGSLFSYKLFGYDEKMNLISVLDSGVNSYNSKSKLTIYKYNQNNDIEEIDKPNDPIYGLIKPTYSYKYDSHGNWIERIEYRGGGNYREPKILTIRKIEYY